MTVLRNTDKVATWNLASFFLAAVSGLFSYRLYISKFGLGNFGVMTLVLSFANLGRIADFGVSSGIARLTSLRVGVSPKKIFATRCRTQPDKRKNLALCKLCSYLSLWFHFTNVASCRLKDLSCWMLLLRCLLFAGRLRSFLSSYYYRCKNYYLPNHRWAE